MTFKPLIPSQVSLYSKEWILHLPVDHQTNSITKWRYSLSSASSNFNNATSCIIQFQFINCFSSSRYLGYQWTRPLVSSPKPPVNIFILTTWSTSMSITSKHLPICFVHFRYRPSSEYIFSSIQYSKRPISGEIFKKYQYQSDVPCSNISISPGT